MRTLFFLQGRGKKKTPPFFTTHAKATKSRAQAKNGWNHLDIDISKGEKKKRKSRLF